MCSYMVNAHRVQLHTVAVDEMRLEVGSIN